MLLPNLLVGCTLSAALASARLGLDHRQAPLPLRFDANGNFKISIFADMHHGSEERAEKDPKSVSVMRGILKEEKPNFAVLLGDLVEGVVARGKEDAHKFVHNVIDPLVKARIPWASVYGNHDTTKKLDPRDLLEVEKRYAATLSYTKPWLGDFDYKADGVTNYHLPIMSSKGGGKPAMILWFLDSRDGKVSRKVIDTMAQKHQELKAKYGDEIPSLVFVHIPDWNKRFQDTFAEMPKVIAQFHGHIHQRNECNMDKPIWCFNQYSGYGGYNAGPRGSRQILLNEVDIGKLKLQTWQRLEDNQVLLNQTLSV